MILCSVLIIFTFFSNGAFAQNSDSTTQALADAGYSMKVLVDSEKEQKVEFTNNKTGEIEIVESEMKGSRRVITVTKNGEILNKEVREDDMLMISDMQNNTTQQFNLKQNNSIDIKDTSIVNPYVVEDPGGEGGLIYSNTTIGKSTVYVAVFSTYVSIVASIAVLSVTATVVISIASLAASLLLPSIYWEANHYYDYSDAPFERRYGKGVSFYSYDNKTGYLGYSWSTWSEYLTPGV
ncbi:hypothetical protein RZN22_10295 [Bacillaceae bacterium S4-13-58]